MGGFYLDDGDGYSLVRALGPEIDSTSIADFVDSWVVRINFHNGIFYDSLGLGRPCCVTGQQRGWRAYV